MQMFLYKYFLKIKKFIIKIKEKIFVFSIEKEDLFQMDNSNETKVILLK